jgi:Rod binding domain-containing protein
VTGVNNITPYTNIAADTAQAGNIVNSGDVQKAARQVEEVFLNELLKIMFQNTELGKDQVISTYLPVFTMEMSKSISKRGMGMQDFFMRSPSFTASVERGMGKKTEAVSGDSGKELKMPNWRMNIRAYEEIMQ